MELENILPNYDFLNPISDQIDFMAKFNHSVTEYLGNIFIKIVRAKEEVEESDMIIHMMFRQIISLQDTITPLIHHGKTDGIKLVIRANLELIIQLLYMVQKDSKIRSLCYLYTTEKKELIKLKKYFSDSKEAEIARSQFNDEVIDEGLLLKFRIQIEDKEALFKTDLFKIIEHLIVDYNYSKKWYTLVDKKIQSIETLSRELKMHQYYEGFYRNLSGVIHSTDVKAGKFKAGDGLISYYDVRYPFNIVENVKLNLLIINKFMFDFISYHMASGIDDHRNWYAEVYMPKMQILDKIDISNK